MKGTKIDIYTAALIITLFGAGATMLIVKTANDQEPIDYSNIDSVLSEFTGSA